MPEVETCPYCHCEPEIEYYLVNKVTRERVGYICACAGVETLFGGKIIAIHGTERIRA